MTSNVGSHIIRDNYMKIDGPEKDKMFEKSRNEVFELLKKTIRPEFLNRIDDIIMFTPLSDEDIKQIVMLQFKQLQNMLFRNQVKIELTPDALEKLSLMSFDPQYGARPVKRVMQKYILNELSRKILEGEVDKGKKVMIDVEDDRLVFKN